MQDKITTIQLKESTKKRLKPYKDVYETYEKGIIMLMDFFENPPVIKQ